MFIHRHHHLYGTLESLLSYSPPNIENTRIIPDTGHDGTIEQMMNQKVRSLADILLDIRNSVTARKQLSGRITAYTIIHYQYVKNKLLELDDWQLGWNRAVEAKRTSLESQLDILLREMRQEQGQCWQDISVLKKEFRHWLKQYLDTIQRIQLVLGMEKPNENSG